MDKEKIKASLENVSISKEANKMIINGCIAKVGVPSTGSPCGANGALVCFTQESVDKCAKSFEGMPLNVIAPNDWWCEGYEAFSGHGDTVVGYLRKVKQKEDNLMAEIVLWKDMNPALAELTISAMDSLGFSVEMYPTVTHNDDKANVQFIDEFEGVGCAMLWSSSAAFSQTFIEKIAASRSDKNMNEEMKKFIEEQIAASLKEPMEKLQASIDSIVAKQDELVMAAEAQAQAQADTVEPAPAEPVNEPAPAPAEPEPVDDAADEIAELKAEIEKLKASVVAQDIPTPTAVGSAAPNPNVEDDKESKLKAEIEKINASTMAPLDKLKAIARAKTSMKG